MNNRIISIILICLLLIFNILLILKIYNLNKYTQGLAKLNIEQRITIERYKECITNNILLQRIDKELLYYKLISFIPIDIFSDAIAILFPNGACGSCISSFCMDLTDKINPDHVFIVSENDNKYLKDELCGYNFKNHIYDTSVFDFLYIKKNLIIIYLKNGFINLFSYDNSLKEFISFIITTP